MPTRLPGYIAPRLSLHLWWLVAFLPLLLPTYLIRLKIGPLPTSVLELLLVAIFILFTMAFGKAGWIDGSKRLKAFRLPILAWYLVSLLAVFWSPDIYHAFGLWRAYILEPILLLFIIAHEFHDINRRELLRLSMYTLVWMLALWGLFQYVTGIGIPSPWNVLIDEGRRATGPFPYPNALALLTAPIGAYAFARFVKSPANALSLVTFGAALLAALVARSDGALVALVAVAIGLLILEKRFRLIGIGIVTIGAIAFVAIPSIRTNVWEEASFQSWSGRVRVWMWQETWQMLKDKPITGAGFGGYQAVIAPYHQKDFIEIFEYPHTIVFNIWSETGLLGLLAFGWLIAIWLCEGWRRGGEYRYVTLAVVGTILIHGLVDVPYFKNDLAVMFWMLFAMSILYLDQVPNRG